MGYLGERREAMGGDPMYQIGGVETVATGLSQVSEAVVRTDPALWGNSDVMAAGVDLQQRLARDVTTTPQGRINMGKNPAENGNR